MATLQIACFIKNRANFRFKALILSWPWILILISLIWLWIFPQKRVTSMMLGFIHGPIYDRQIEIDGGIALARLSHGLIGLYFLALASELIEWRSARSKTIALTIGVLSFLAAGYPSQRHGLHALQSELPKLITGADVEFYYDSSKPNADETAKQLVRDAVFHVKEIKESFGLTTIRPLKIFAYSSEVKKKLLFGGGQTDVTDVKTPTVHIDFQPSPHPTLRHELIHAVASYASWMSLGFHPNMLVTEGVAMALAPVDYSLSLDQLAAGLIKSGRVGDVAHLFNPLGFWSESGTRSYAVAGSLLRWISGRFGPEALRSIYAGQTLRDVTGRSGQQLVDSWQADILSYDTEKTAMLIESLSREPSVLADICPHSVADLARKRSDGWFVRLRQPMGWDPYNWVDWRSRLSSGDRHARLEALRSAVKKFVTTSINDRTGLHVWIETIDKSRTWPPKVLEDVEAAIIASDLHALVGATNQSNALLTDLREFMKTRLLGVSTVRQIEARLALAEFMPADGLLAWRRYLAGWGELPAVVEEQSWIEVYLRARRSNRATPETMTLWASLLGKTSDYQEIRREWLKMLANGWFELADYEKAESVYKDIAADSTGEARLLADEHVRRMQYLKSSGIKL